MTTFDSGGTWDNAGTFDDSVLGATGGVPLPSALTEISVIALSYLDTAAPTLLAQPAGLNDTVLYLQRIINYPAPPFLLSLERGTVLAEVVMVTDVNATAVTVTRGADGLSLPHDAGVTVEHVITRLDHQGANDHYSSTTLDVHTQYLSGQRHSVTALHQPGITLALPDALPGLVALGGSTSAGTSLTGALSTHAHPTPPLLVTQAAVVPAAAIMINAAAAAAAPPWLSPTTPTTTDLVYSPLVALTAEGAPTAGAPVLTTVTVSSSPASAPPIGYVAPTFTTSVTSEQVIGDTFTYTVTEPSYVVESIETPRTNYLAFSTPLEDFYQMGVVYTNGSPASGVVYTATFEVSTAAAWARNAGFFATSASPAGFYPNNGPAYTVSLFGPSPVEIVYAFRHPGGSGYTSASYFDLYNNGTPTPLYFYTLTQARVYWLPETVSVSLPGGGTEVVPVTTQVVSSAPPLLPAVWGVGVSGDATAYTDTTASATSTTTYVVSGAISDTYPLSVPVQPGSTTTSVSNGVRTTVTESATAVLTSAQYTQATGQTPDPDLTYFGYQVTIATQDVTATVVTTTGSHVEAISGVFVPPYVPSAAFAADHWGLLPAVGVVLPGESTGASGADLRLVGWVPA
jgi:hypothetical protein